MGGGGGGGHPGGGGGGGGGGAGGGGGGGAGPDGARRQQVDWLLATVPGMRVLQPDRAALEVGVAPGVGLRVGLPSGFPDAPPEFRLSQPLGHPMVSADGRVAGDVLSQWDPADPRGLANLVAFLVSALRGAEALPPPGGSAVHEAQAAGRRVPEGPGGGAGGGGGGTGGWGGSGRWGRGPRARGGTDARAAARALGVPPAPRPDSGSP